MCYELKLPPSYDCSQACLTSHWPRHKAYHKAQKDFLPMLVKTEEMPAAIEKHRSIAKDPTDHPNDLPAVSYSRVPSPCSSRI